ncbi:MAG: hypothetical protein QOH06_3808 [Acidobacteriota bacterium]|nr:hypothetical protein [Acidobacteriota bacterium]
MTSRIQCRIVLTASLALLLSFAGIRPSAAQSGLPYWTEIAQGGAVPDALWDGASAYHQGLFYIFGGLNGTFPNDEPVADFSVFDVDTLTGPVCSRRRTTSATSGCSTSKRRPGIRSSSTRPADLATRQREADRR